MGKFNKVISEAFQIKEEEIKDDLKYQGIEKWDSLNHLNLVSRLEEEFKVEFDMDEIIAMENIQKIKELLAKHGISENELC